ncbi:20167_t:CDS:2, partial [Dentiscutata erythropus]
TVRKTRKSKTNNFISILDLFLDKYNLSVKSTPLQLCAHADELGIMLPDWKARKDMKEALHQRLFKDNQIEALLCQKNNIDEAIVAASSCISQFRRKLAEAGVGSEQIDIYAKLPE